MTLHRSTVTYTRYKLKQNGIKWKEPGLDPLIKKRKYSHEYLSFGFIESRVDSNKPKCIFCGEILSFDAMKPAKLQRHHESRYASTLTQDSAYFDVRN